MIDIGIIGAGPAGSFLASLLSKNGFSVSLFDKQKSPVPHLPETLFAEKLNLFKEIGVSSKKLLKDCSKPISVSFLNSLGTQSLNITHKFFDNSWLLIDRLKFDEILLKCAEKSGVTYKAPVTVDSVQFYSNYCEVAYRENGKNNIEECRIVVDASGKSALFLSAPERKIKRRILDKNMCIFSHFEGTISDPKFSFDSMSIIEIEQGHIFVIPVSPNRISVGTILLKNPELDPNVIFENCINQISWLKELLSKLKKVFPCVRVENQSYSGTKVCSPRYVILGDSSYLSDPFFCNGLETSITMAKNAAELISYLLKKNITYSDKIQKCKDYKSSYKKTIQLLGTKMYGDLDKNVSIIQQKTLVDPHIPYSLLFFLLNLCGRGKDVKSVLQKLRANIGN